MEGKLCRRLGDLRVPRAPQRQAASPLSSAAARTCCRVIYAAGAPRCARLHRHPCRHQGVGPALRCARRQPESCVGSDRWRSRGRGGVLQRGVRLAYGRKNVQSKCRSNGFACIWRLRRSVHSAASCRPAALMPRDACTCLQGWWDLTEGCKLALQGQEAVGVGLVGCAICSSLLRVVLPKGGPICPRLSPLSALGSASPALEPGPRGAPALRCVRARGPPASRAQAQEP